jgi:hypothetical protein
MIASLLALTSAAVCGADAPRPDAIPVIGAAERGGDACALMAVALIVASG